MKKHERYKIFVNLILALICLSIIIPFGYLISLSITSEDAIISGTYRLIPQKIDFAAYKSIFDNSSQLINSYKITIAFSLIGTLLSMIVMLMIAYALSREQFLYKRQVAFFVYFTMLFSGGLIPHYIINTRYLHLTNSFWVYVLPSLASAYHILILRTFLKGLPASLTEAAKIDGASEFTIFRVIVLPLSKPVIATVSLMMLLNYWNNWQTSLLYITDTSKFSLQYLLQKILRETEFMQSIAKEGNIVANENYAQTQPVESMRFAMAILAAGPMMVVFPFFQKYFTRGLTIGAVKG